MFRNKTKLIYHTDKPVLATFAVSFLEHSETQIRQVAAQQDRSYKSLLSACRQGLAWKSLLPAFSTALDAAVYEAVATAPSVRIVDALTLRILKSEVGGRRI